MVVNDELLACYIDGTCSTEEKKAVLEYLSKHPEEYEHVFTMMDLYRRVPEMKYRHTTIGSKKGSYCDIAMSAAAFAPIAQNDKSTGKNINFDSNQEIITRALSIFSEVEQKQ